MDELGAMAAQRGALERLRIFGQLKRDQRQILQELRRAAMPRPEEIGDERDAQLGRKPPGGAARGFVIRVEVAGPGGDELLGIFEQRAQVPDDLLFLRSNGAVRDPKAMNARSFNAQDGQRVSLLALAHRCQTGDASVGVFTVGDGDDVNVYLAAAEMRDEPSCTQRLVIRMRRQDDGAAQRRLPGRE